MNKKTTTVETSTVYNVQCKRVQLYSKSRRNNKNVYTATKFKNFTNVAVTWEFSKTETRIFTLFITLRNRSRHTVFHACMYKQLIGRYTTVIKGIIAYLGNHIE